MAKQTSKFGKNWYVLHTHSGYEDTVARNLRQRIESLGMQDKI
ncbi:MAG: transcription termination/antitermination NusG family protein, partial [Patescibacteria group bacterium]